MLKDTVLKNGNLVEIFLATEANNPKKESYGVQIFETSKRQKLKKVYNFKTKKEAEFFISTL